MHHLTRLHIALRGGDICIVDTLHGSFKVKQSHDLWFIQVQHRKPLSEPFTAFTNCRRCV